MPNGPGTGVQNEQTLPSATRSDVPETSLGAEQRAIILGHVSGSLLHEFNNILTVITGTIDMLAASVADRPELAGVVRLIDDAALRGARLTAQFLGFDRGSPAELREADIGSVLADAVRLLRPLCGRRAEVILLEPNEPIVARVDPGLLTIALLCLATSLPSDLPQGSRIDVTARTASAASVTGPQDAAKPAGVAIQVEILCPGSCGKACLARDLPTVAELVVRAGGTLSAPRNDADAATIVIRLGASVTGG